MVHQPRVVDSIHVPAQLEPKPMIIQELIDKLSKHRSTDKVWLYSDPETDGIAIEHPDEPYSVCPYAEIIEIPA